MGERPSEVTRTYAFDVTGLLTLLTSKPLVPNIELEIKLCFQKKLLFDFVGPSKYTKHISHSLLLKLSCCFSGERIYRDNNKSRSFR